VVISFSDLRTTAPEIAEPIAARFATSGLGMLGTLRRDGSPRVSPIEVALHEGRMYVGMMPGSTKHHDVERDARVSLVTAIADKDDLAGEGKLFGVASRITVSTSLPSGRASVTFARIWRPSLIVAVESILGSGASAPIPRPSRRTMRAWRVAAISRRARSFRVKTARCKGSDVASSLA